MTPATTYRTSIRHVRRGSVANRFRYRSDSWLVDLDAVPRLPRGLRWLASFDARDHLGEPDSSLRDNVTGRLARHGIDVTGGRILMLANARSLGHIFNPISVHWCYSASGELAAVVAEVHNTYGDRHAYLLMPNRDGSIDAAIPKAMYVSPFNPVDGEYRITVSPPVATIAVGVTLVRPGQPPFVATLRGSRTAPRSVLRAAVGTAATSVRVSLLIRWEGIRLFLRGLPVEPRPIHVRQEAV